MRTLNFAVPIMILCFTGFASGATIVVDWAGSGDEMTIQAGINSAGAGDTVLVLSGTYTEAGNQDLSFGGTNRVLMSAGGSSVTIVDCGNAGRGFLFIGGEDTTSVVRGFKITKAAADSGAGAICRNGSRPRFEECVFLENAAGEKGGGLCCDNSSPVIRNCRFEGNTALGTEPPLSQGGGMACVNGSSPLIEDTNFELNVAKSSGGGLYSGHSSPSCVRCEFVNNNLVNTGYDGGGAYITNSDGTSIVDCTFRENGTAQPIVGGGLEVYSSAVTVTGCAFTGNVAGNSGGAHFVSGSSGTVSGCTFSGNQSTWNGAAGMGCYYDTNITVTGCTFVKNLGDNIRCYNSSPTIEYSILAFSETGEALVCAGGTETPEVHHCFVFGNADADTLCGGNYHDIENSDPRLCDMFSGNFQLCADSPCLAGATWSSQVGAYGQGCPACGSPAESKTWGAIKAVYR